LTVGRLAAAEKTQQERLAVFREELERLGADIDASREAIESASANGAADGHPDVALAELLERQTRIANEVARHEIAFHQELAALANRLMRERPGR
jgi:hypothetical protein